MHFIWISFLHSFPACALLRNIYIYTPSISTDTRDWIIEILFFFSGCDKWDITPEHNLVVPPVQKYDKGSTLAITCKAPTKFEPIIFQKETGGITLTCSGGKWMYGTTNKVAVDVFRCVSECAFIELIKKFVTEVHIIWNFWTYLIT